MPLRNQLESMTHGSFRDSAYWSRGFQYPSDSAPGPFDTALGGEVHQVRAPGIAAAWADHGGVRLQDRAGMAASAGTDLGGERHQVRASALYHLKRALSTGEKHIKFGLLIYPIKLERTLQHPLWPSRSTWANRTPFWPRPSLWNERKKTPGGGSPLWGCSSIMGTDWRRRCAPELQDRAAGFGAGRKPLAM